LLVAAKDVPLAYRLNRESLQIETDKEFDIVYVNNGDRPVTILLSDVLYLQPSENAPRCNEYKFKYEPSPGVTNLAPFVVKEKEAVTKRVRITEMRYVQDPVWLRHNHTRVHVLAHRTLKPRGGFETTHHRPLLLQFTLSLPSVAFVSY
jgi:hypothetical protein